MGDWDAWGDEREVQRRKAERKRANLPLDQRRQQVGPGTFKAVTNT